MEWAFLYFNRYDVIYTEQVDKYSSAWSLTIYLKGRKENTFIAQKVYRLQTPNIKILRIVISKENT